MCNPALAIPLALGAAGAGVNAYETNQTQRAMTDARNRATLAELDRQRGYQQKSGQIFNDSLNNFTPEAQAKSLSDAQATTADAFTGNAPVSVGSVGSGNGPQIVKTAEDKAVADAFSRGSAKDAALAKLTGWDQRAFGNNINLNNSGRNLDLNSDFAKTSAAVNGLEQNAAYKNAFRPNSGFGDLLGFAGSVAGYNAGQGGGLFNGMFQKPIPSLPFYAPNDL